MKTKSARYFGIAGIVLAVLFLAWYLRKANHRVSRIIHYGRLYPICENNRWGYIDSAGEVIVEPQFFSAQRFSEGLGAVRQDGFYGYVDLEGKISIKQQYDYAEPFRDGIALVYSEGKRSIISRKGETIVPACFDKIERTSISSVLKVQTFSGKWGLYNTNGRLIIDTAWGRIGSFGGGLLSVDRFRPDGSYNTSRTTCSLIDTAGTTIIPFGKYNEISLSPGGIAIALKIDTVKRNNYQETAFNKEGEILFEVPVKKWSFVKFESPYEGNFAIVRVYITNPDSITNWNVNNQYAGLVDTKGEIVFADRKFSDLVLFGQSHAFAKLEGGKWMLIDLEGKLCNESFFEKIYDSEESGTPKFSEGKAFVRTKDGWGIIDTLGHYLVAPQKSTLLFQNITRIGNAVIDYDYDSDESVAYYWDPLYKIAPSEKYAGIGFDADDELILFSEKKGKLTYRNKSLKIVWEGKDFQPDGETLNIDYMNEGYFRAGSPPQNKSDKYGGWATSGNMYLPVKKEIPVLKNNLQLFIDTMHVTDWHGYKGYAVYLSNASGDTAYFQAEDSRLPVVLQAKNKKGEWMDIEYLMHSWCGNSYHTLYLPKNKYWPFSSPVYEGDFKTRIRAVVVYYKDDNDKDKKVLYSNEISGSVNPAQFWRKRQYFPGGLMDPYSG